mmetsp:Transcript_61274/g.126576  ORF Transcript_61274/g.126576 Transcript_61274/m.126576 type:complete len:290 (-) Transcript_61274:1967-2836(-)
MKIRNIWKDDLDKIKNDISELIESYSHVAMDTEFPGIVTHPEIDSEKKSECSYEILKLNVDLLNIIQIGFTFATDEGFVPEEKGCWQFNFHFDLKEHLFAQDSLDLLLRSGVDFQAHEKKGINVNVFANFLISSGLVLNKKIKWVSFHSGYDFGYLIKILTNKVLPENRIEFFQLLNIYFPCSFDVKYLSLCSQNLNGGLNKLAEKLKVERIGKVHQAGSDSLLTLDVFFKLKSSFFKNPLEEMFEGVLYGLGSFSGKKFFIAQHESKKEKGDSFSDIFLETRMYNQTM